MIATMNLAATVVLALVAIVARPSSGCMYAKFTPAHTLCISKPSQCPITKGNLDGGDIDLILRAHNMHRSFVAMGLEKRGKGAQPPAADMLEMTWDSELAKIAQKWTDQCKIQHDCLVCREVDRFMVGQNIYVTFTTAEGTEPEWEVAIKSWYNEVTMFSPSMIKPFVFSKPLGHYTQVVWSISDKIGCGYAAYKQGKFNYKLYICNYGPGGNIVNNQMYEQGPACSKCPDGSSCSTVYNGLCSYGSSGGKGAPKVITNGGATRTSRSLPTTTTPTTTTTRKTTTTFTTTVAPTTTTLKVAKPQRWWNKNNKKELSTPAINTNQINVQISPVNNKRVVPISRRRTVVQTQTTKTSFANHPPFDNQGLPNNGIQKFPVSSTTEKISGQKILSGSPIIETRRQQQTNFRQAVQQNNRQVIVPSDNVPIRESDIRRETPKPIVRTTPGRKVTTPRTKPTVIECNFDSKLCPISRIGTALWFLKIDSTQGKYYDSVLRAGESTRLFIMDGNAIPINKRSCLSFNYRKFPVIGETGIPLEYSVHLFSGPAIQGEIQFDTNTDWAQEQMDLPAGINLSVISFKMSMPPGNPSRAYHISLDDIVIEEGACASKK